MIYQAPAQYTGDFSFVFLFLLVFSVTVYFSRRHWLIFNIASLIFVSSISLFIPPFFAVFFLVIFCMCSVMVIYSARREQMKDRQAALVLAEFPSVWQKHTSDPRVYFSSVDDRIGFIWPDRHTILHGREIAEWTFSHQTDTSGRPLYTFWEGRREIEFRFWLVGTDLSAIQLRFQANRRAARRFEAALSAHTGGRRGRFVPSTLPPYDSGSGSGGDSGGGE